jgi:16S rRNA (guanine1207-N2)-methyltransferase
MPASRNRTSREARVAGVMAAHLEMVRPLSGRVLAVDDEAGAVEAELARSGALVSAWRRRAVGDRPAHPWSPDGPFHAATLRLPKGRESLRMVLHAAVSRIRQGGSLCLYGSNDEGVRSAGPLLESVLREVRTVETRGHCRIWRGIRGAEPDHLRSALSDWESRFTLELPGGAVQVLSYPGLFAHGRLDDGTRLLIGSLPRKLPGLRVLDFGCGAGVIGLALRQRFPEVELDLVDSDALAVEAARRNLPDARVHLGDAWSALPGTARFDLVVSNPPLHRGKGEDFELIGKLIDGAARRLGRCGELLVVAQRRLDLGRWLGDRFAALRVERESRGFRLWCATRPSR